MPKTGWEARVGMLIDPARHKEFVYSYKPHDSGLYGGQPRPDWLACDLIGRAWMIEVKSSPATRKSITIEREVSAGQIAALSAIARSEVGIALLAVGCGDMLYVFDWRKIQWVLEAVKIPGSNPSLIPFMQADWSFQWKGPKAWQSHNLYDAVIRPMLASFGRLTIPTPGPMPMGPSGPVILVPGTLAGSLPYPSPFGIPPMPPPSGSPSPDIPVGPSPSTLRPRASTRMRRRKLLSGPVLSKPPE